MKSNSKNLVAPATVGSSAYKHKRSTTYLLGQLIISVLGLSLGSPLAHAQTTSCTGASSDSCVDLYQGTLAAMQTVGFQPSGSSPNSGATYNADGAPTQPILAPWVITSFSGGVINGSPMVFTVPANTGVPGNQNLASTFIYNCPGNTATSSGTVTLSATISDTTQISSTQSVTNSTETFNNGSSTVTIGYAPPNTTGGFSASTTNTYNWGQQTTESTTTGGGTSNTTGTASTYTYDINYNVAPGYGQTISLNNSVTQYSGVNWTSQINVTGTLSNTIFSQKFRNTVQPQATTQSLNGSGIPANIWYPPTTWSSTNGDVLASPSGVYAFFPSGDSHMYGVDWKTANQINEIFKQAGDYKTNIGIEVYLGTDSPDNNKYGTFWGGTLPGQYNPPEIQWHPTVSPAYIAVQDDGNFVAYSSSNKNIWSSGTGGHSLSITPPQMAYSATLQQLLPSGTPFTATGNYDSTTYATTATIGQTTPVPLTSDQLAQYCPNSSVSHAPTPETVPFGNAQYVRAAYNPDRESGSYVKAQLRDDEQERLRLEALRRNESGERQLNAEERDFQTRNSVGDNEKRSFERRRALGRIEKIKGPLVLKPGQFYVADLPGLKVTKVTVRSDSLTNYVGFAPGSPDVRKEDLTKSKTVRLHIGKARKFSVQPKPMI